MMICSNASLALPSAKISFSVDISFFIDHHPMRHYMGDTFEKLEICGMKSFIGIQKTPHLLRGFQYHVSDN